MPRNDRRRRGGQTVQRSCISIRRAPKEDYLRQGPTFHFGILQGVVQAARNLAKPQHCLSPTDGQTVGENQSACRDSTPDLLQLSAERLGTLVAHNTVRHKCQALSDNEASPIRALDGLHTESASGGALQQSSNNRTAQRADQRSQKTGPGGDETSTRTVRAQVNS